jgi:uncharacterized protein (DUF2235 family)
MQKTLMTNPRMCRDTVSSVGIFPRYLPFVNNNSSIHYFRHALALDERRSKFTPNFHREWRDEIHKDDDQDDDGDDQSQDTSGTTFGGTETKSPTEARSPGAGGLEDQQDSSESALNDKEDENSGHKHTEQWRYEQEINQSCKQKTDSLEVWFAGAHAGEAVLPIDEFVCLHTPVWHRCWWGLGQK